MKRVVVIPAIVAVAALSSATLAISRATAERSEEAFELNGWLKQEDTVDLGPEGDSLGDLYLEAGDLFRDAKKVGRYQGTCVAVAVPAPGSAQSECWFTLALPEGQVSLRGGYGPGINGENPVRNRSLGARAGMRSPAVTPSIRSWRTVRFEWKFI